MNGSKPENFEQAMKRLDEIAASLDSGTLSLDHSLKLFAEGAELIAYCNKSLEEAKLKLEELFPGENSRQSANSSVGR